jgi:hypothetical protein
MSTGAYLLIPLVNPGLYSTTVAEPAPGETAWASGGTYAVGDLRAYAATHRLYKCVQAHAGRTTTPDADPAYWLDWAPTNARAMFDDAINTQTSAADSFTAILRPGEFFNGFDVYGCDCASLTYIYKDAPGGNVIASATLDMTDPPYDWYDWAFGPIRALSSARVSDLTPYAGSELTITFTNTGGAAKCGLLALGDRRDLLDGAQFGGVVYGATANLVDNTLYQKRSDGSTKAILQPNTVDVDITMVMPREFGDPALAAVRSVLGVPCGWYATEISGYDSLAAFGRATARLTFDSFGHATLNLNIKGLP